MSSSARHARVAALSFAASVLCGASTMAQPMAMTDHDGFRRSIFQQVLPSERTMPRYESTEPEQSDVQVPAHLRRQIVSYQSREAPGTIVIDTSNTYGHLEQ